MLLNTCDEWSIDKDQISAVVTGNAPNMVKAVELAFEQCKPLRELISKVKDVVTWFKQSNIASNELPMLHASELAHLSSVLQVLRPIEAATKEVTGDKYCTSSKVIPLIHCLVLKIKPLSFDDSIAKELQSLVLKEIQKRMGVIENVTPLAIATVLDPRFKKMHFTDPLACSAAVGKIKDLMKAAAHNTTKDSESSELSDKNEDNYSLWEDHHKLVHKSWKLSRPMTLFLMSWPYIYVAQWVDSLKPIGNLEGLGDTAPLIEANRI
ncbi:zinc finger BED domain-containing protein 4-like [Bactrocera tryoni]|uniref:zinc finger BED domain-containing protein 4-like n=1 Tax=Bactrocera tryoni TaxID=59916 RepID=UPI001A9770C5|nr:zinc finger BED domain-containing protein 4-like [Bactrocera tryoni]